MKRILIWGLALIIALFPSYSCAADDLRTVIDGICAHARGELSIQDWIDGPLSQTIGSPSDDYVLMLRKLGVEADYDAYARSVSAKLASGEVSSPTARQRCALALIACGERALIPTGLADETIGKKGIMSCIFGLHLLNNGVPSKDWTQQSLVEKLCSMQLADGGWAIMGQNADMDVTAMCLQALYPSGLAGEDVTERALNLISARQLASGGFTGMGKENAESAAQVLIALSGMGISADDARFMKDGHNALDALLSYQLPSGGFPHLPGDAENSAATMQAMQALTALQHVGAPYYDFSAEEALPAALALSAPASTLPTWKLWAFGAIALLALIGALSALIRKNGRKKQLIFVLILAIIAAAGVWYINIESTDSYYDPDAASSRPIAGHAWLSIRCDTVAGRSDDGSTPEDGCVLARTELPFAQGDSVFDQLTSAARKFRIQTEHEGGEGDAAYVTAINHLYECAYGELSGWIYGVNGEVHSVGCGSYALKDGDEVLWQYSLELGEDLTWAH